MGIIKFIFSSFWIFLGVVILMTLAAGLLNILFEFIVELIHGEPVVQNIYNSYERPKDLSLDRKEENGEEEGRK